MSCGIRQGVDAGGALAWSDDDRVVVVAGDEVQVLYAAHLGRHLARPTALLQHTRLYAYKVGFTYLYGVALIVNRSVEVEGGVRLVRFQGSVNVAIRVGGIAVANPVLRIVFVRAVAPIVDGVVGQ